MTRPTGPSSGGLQLVPCPVCGAAGDFLPVRNTRTDGHIGKYGDLYAGRATSEWRVCSGCGFVHQNPRPSMEALNEFYRRGQYHTHLPDLVHDVGRFVAAARQWYSGKIRFAARAAGLNGGRVFDVGAGLGGAMKVFEEFGWEAIGVESDVASLAFARGPLGLAGLTEGLLDSRTRVDPPVDLVFSNHTFEHVADLHEAMRGIVAVLRPGGYVFTAVPTYFRNRSRMSLLYMNAAHYSMFTHRSLGLLFNEYGFEEVAHTYRGSAWVDDELWHVARYTGTRHDPARFHDDPIAVRRYVNRTNPLNTLLYTPTRWVRAVAASYPAQVASLLVRSPRAFARRAVAKLRPLPPAGGPSA